MQLKPKVGSPHCFTNFDMMTLNHSNSLDVKIRYVKGDAGPAIQPTNQCSGLCTLILVCLY